MNKISDEWTCPPELQTTDYLPWSRGRGVDVWAMFVASMTGDLETVQKFVAAEPGLASCELGYLTPAHFALREGQIAVTRFLLELGVNPFYTFSDPPLKLVRDRGYKELEEWLTGFLKERYRIVPEGEEMA